MMKVRFFKLAALFLACLALLFALPALAVSGEGQEYYSFVWLTDTQYYCSDYPYIYYNMTQWIQNNSQALNLKYVFHTGDFVDSNTAWQWEISDRAMSAVDETCPWFAVAGNHDVDTSSANYSGFLKHVGKDHFDSLGNTDSLYYKEGVGRCDFFSQGGRDYMFIGLGWLWDDSALKWLKSTLADYPEKAAILMVHNYINTDGQLTDVGQKLFDQVVSQYPNVKLVLCGHRYASRLRQDQFDDDGDGTPDRLVYQVMGNYQASGHGGQGFLRILKVYSDRIEMIAYSPYLDAYNLTDDMEEPQPESFTIPTDTWD